MIRSLGAAIVFTPRECALIVLELLFRSHVLKRRNGDGMSGTIYVHIVDTSSNPDAHPSDFMLTLWISWSQAMIRPGHFHSRVN